MWFHFCAANHFPIGRQSLGDMYDWFSAGLLDLGHRVTWHDTCAEPAAINVFWEFFLPGWSQKLTDAGITYGIVATEYPDGSGFNRRTTESGLDDTRDLPMLRAAHRSSGQTSKVPSHFMSSLHPRPIWNLDTPTG